MVVARRAGIPRTKGRFGTAGPRLSNWPPQFPNEPAWLVKGSHLQVDIPERDALGNERSRPKTGQPVGWTATTLLASLAAIAGSRRGGTDEAKSWDSLFFSSRASPPLEPSASASFSASVSMGVSAIQYFAVEGMADDRVPRPRQGVSGIGTAEEK